MSTSGSGVGVGGGGSGVGVEATGSGVGAWDAGPGVAVVTALGVWVGSGVGVRPGGVSAAAATGAALTCTAVGVSAGVLGTGVDALATAGVLGPGPPVSVGRATGLGGAAVGVAGARVSTVGPGAGDEVGPAEPHPAVARDAVSAATANRNTVLYRFTLLPGGRMFDADGNYSLTPNVQCRGDRRPRHASCILKAAGLGGTPEDGSFPHNGSRGRRCRSQRPR